ncbi:MAG: diaminopimelate epimerase [Acidimicrobiales bacterium]|nr:diaminopimelate epimerase [Acidimicrobiales bacterium]
MTFRLTKHHGLGNDFLVLLGTAEDVAAVGPDHARRWCDRRRGVGADGLLIGTIDPPRGDLGMVLFNADGSRAEMSGNGIRCLAQAEAERRGVAEIDLVVVTDDGDRSVQVRPGPDPATVEAAVAMGPARPGPAADAEVDRRHDATVAPAALAAEPKEAVTLDLGNPHLVLLVDDPGQVDVGLAGPRWEAAYRDGINVHAVAPTPGEADALTMAIWERGAGATEACGTGATAAARAAHDWGLVGDRVRVHMRGGDVDVEVGPEMVLRGPAVRIATVEVEA